MQRSTPGRVTRPLVAVALAAAAALGALTTAVVASPVVAAPAGAVGVQAGLPLCVANRCDR
jgi:hypothetical protein